jgi:endonuclease-3
MAASNRTALINQTYKVLKRHYKPVRPEGRTIFEHLLYACCLENSPHEAAETALVVLRGQFFDWNEIRVSTARELAETMKMLEDPEDTALRVKQVLQSVFESLYAFDLETLSKENIGQAVAKLQKLDGTTPFVVAYVTQQGLGGHSIPVNRGLLESFRILGVISDAEASAGVVPGLERAIPKSKGIEAGSVIHNLGVLFSKNPYSPAVRKLLLEIVPQCKDRLPKRPSKAAPTKESDEAAATAQAAPEKKPSKKAAGKRAASKETPAKKPATDKIPKKSAPKTEPKPAKKTPAKKKSPTKRLAKRKPK